MKPIEVRDQVRLSTAQSLYLTAAGMYYRLTRSAITVAIVALAIAFLTYMLSYSLILQERVYDARNELQQSRVLGEWRTRLTSPDPLPRVVSAMRSEESASIAEYRAWGAVESESEFRGILDALNVYGMFLRSFDGMRVTSRAVLLGDDDPYLLPRVLLDSVPRALFVRQVAGLGLTVPLGSSSALDDFLSTDWPVVDTFLARVRRGQRAANSAFWKSAQSASLAAWLAQDTAAVFRALADAGYANVDRDKTLLYAQARVALAEEELVRLAGIPEVRIAVARLMSVDQKAVHAETMLAWFTSVDRAGAFCRSVVESVPGAVLQDSVIMYNAAKRHRRISMLQDMMSGMPESQERGLAGIPTGTRWLIVVSFLVCAVGICNTMFMSVTERFTEIATMKCLGAMDGFVMTMFVFEAAIQGFAGSLAGIVIGIGLAALRGMAGYGTAFFERVPFASIGVVALAAVGVGMALAAVSAVGPAWMAARLAPMEAMRVE